jgi:hypothetical protein
VRAPLKHFLQAAAGRAEAGVPPERKFSAQFQGVTGSPGEPPVTPGPTSQPPPAHRWRKPPPARVRLRRRRLHGRPPRPPSSGARLLRAPAVRPSPMEDRRASLRSGRGCRVADCAGPAVDRRPPPPATVRASRRRVAQPRRGRGLRRCTMPTAGRCGRRRGADACRGKAPRSAAGKPAASLPPPTAGGDPRRNCAAFRWRGAASGAAGSPTP